MRLILIICISMGVFMSCSSNKKASSDMSSDDVIQSSIYKKPCKNDFEACKDTFQDSDQRHIKNVQRKIVLKCVFQKKKRGEISSKCSNLIDQNLSRLSWVERRVFFNFIL